MRKLLRFSFCLGSSPVIWVEDARLKRGDVALQFVDLGLKCIAPRIRFLCPPRILSSWDWRLKFSSRSLST